MYNNNNNKKKINNSIKKVIQKQGLSTQILNGLFIGKAKVVGGESGWVKSGGENS